jgi:hypothetical protein
MNRAGEKYVNFAFITKDGVPVGPPDPLDRTSATFTPTPDVLFFSSGDHLTVNLQDTSGGFQIVIHDLTTGQSGTMTASAAYGFGHPLYQPTASTCSDASYTFHPMCERYRVSVRTDARMAMATCQGRQHHAHLNDRCLYTSYD